MKKVTLLAFLGLGYLAKVNAAPYQDTVSSHIGSLKASYAYTTVRISTSFKMPILGFGKRIRIRENDAVDFSTQATTTLRTSAIYVDSSYLRYMLWDHIYVGAGGGVSLGLKRIRPNFIGFNPIVKFGLEFARSFHQINYTPKTFTDKISYKKDEDGKTGAKHAMAWNAVHLISYQIGYKY